ncbi:MAG: hypothetical protein ACLGHN_00510 [Bacteriovoracia bacterium]
MNLRGPLDVENEKVNVVSLFGNTNEDIIQSDPLMDLIKESEIEDAILSPESVTVRSGKVANEDLSPDQSLFILEEQMTNLRSNLNRIKFYLGELDDILQR